MPKRQTGWTEAKIFRYIKEGRGQGELAFKPLDNNAGCSKWSCTSFRGSREHHLLLELEFKYLCFFDWAENVIEIPERFPLDRELTLQIAEDLAINHPTDKKTKNKYANCYDYRFLLNYERKYFNCL